MRTDEKPGIHLVAQVQVGELAGDEWLAVMGGGKDESSAFPLELEDIGIGDGQDDLLGNASPAASELEGGEVHAVPGAIRVRSVGFQAGADHPADFAMVHGARADEFRPGAKDKIALHFFPDELKFVPASPHVGAGSGQGVFLQGGVVAGRAGEFGRADIGVSGEFPHRNFLGKSGQGQGG